MDSDMEFALQLQATFGSENDAMMIYQRMVLPHYSNTSCGHEIGRDCVGM